MSLRRLLVLLVAVLLVAAGITFAVLHWSNQRAGSAGGVQSSGQDGYFAYTTSSGLVVMHSSQTVARVDRLFDPDPSDPGSQNVVWTHSGAYVAVLSDATLRQQDLSAEQLIVVNAHTGEQRRIGCAYCSSIIAIGANGILARGDQAFTFDLATPRLTAASATLPPLPNGASQEPLFLASTPDYMMVSQTLSIDSSDTEDEPILWQTGDSVSVIRSYPTEPRYLAPAAATEDATHRTARFAAVSHSNAGICDDLVSVHILDSAGNDASTDLAAVLTNPNLKIDVLDLWWGLDNHFHATIESWTCDNTKQAETDKKVLAGPPTLWRLDGQKWTQEGSQQVTMVRQLTQTARIALVIPPCVGAITNPDPQTYCHVGTLYRDEGGARTTIASDVISISTPQ